MHLKKQPEMVVTRARPKQTSRDHHLQSMMAQNRSVNLADLARHQNFITMVAHLISITKDPQAVAGVIAVVECVVEASVTVAASAALAETSPSVEALEAGEAEVALKAATNHST